MSDVVLAEAGKHIPGLRKGAGVNYTGFCPLHGEKPGKSTPSFSFNSATGQWFCFAGCGGGTFATFLRMLGQTRPLIDRVMQRLDPYLVKVTPKMDVARAAGLFETPYPLPEAILGLYEQCPLNLLNAGFDEGLLWAHDVGFDDTTQRITFPIRDLNGKLAGISGRDITGTAHERYKVYRKEIEALGYPRYALEKSHYIWRWDRVYPRVYGEPGPNTIYLTEGFKACLWLVQHGYENTLALMGSALSEVQQAFLERLGGTVVLCLDNNRAGLKATYRIGYRLRGVRVLVMRYPAEVQQPDGLSPEDLHVSINEASAFHTWRREHELPLERLPSLRAR